VHQLLDRSLLLSGEAREELRAVVEAVLLGVGLVEAVARRGVELDAGV
jgi:hypothetical protein